MSSGNWLIAILSVVVFSLIAVGFAKDPKIPEIYQVYITYAVALSLIFSGPLQLMFTRFVADRLFEKKDERVLPNFFGALVLSMFVGLSFSFLISLYLFKGFPYHYHMVFSFTVAVMCGVWLANVLLTGLKSYKYIFLSFALSYITTGLLLLFAVRIDVWFTFLVFYTGQSLLLALLVVRIIMDYPSDRLISFEFLSKRQSKYSLAFTGLFYNLGIWGDKFVFWFSPTTGTQVFGNIRASVLYDIPVVLAYVSLVPGIAVFFLKLEVEFAQHYEKYYDAVREWGTLKDLYRLANKMIDSANTVLYETLRLQGIATLMLFFIEEWLFRFLGFSFLYIPLFNVLLVGALLQLAFMVIFALLSYYDRRREIMYMTLSFALLNFCLSILTQFLGPFFYGYGYALSLLLPTLMGMIMLRGFLNEVHYRTYMLSL